MLNMDIRSDEEFRILVKNFGDKSIMEKLDYLLVYANTQNDDRKSKFLNHIIMAQQEKIEEDMQLIDTQRMMLNEYIERDHQI